MNLSSYFGAERGRLARMAKSTGLAPGFLLQIASGARPAPADRCAAIERASGGLVRRWDLRTSDWAEIWPELIGADGAPAVEAQAGMRDAA